MRETLQPRRRPLPPDQRQTRGAHGRGGSHHSDSGPRAEIVRCSMRTCRPQNCGRSGIWCEARGEWMTGWCSKPWVSRARRSLVYTAWKLLIFGIYSGTVGQKEEPMNLEEKLDLLMSLATD